MSVVRKLFLDLPVPRKLVVILWLFLVVVVGLLGLSYLTIENLSAARAYVGGEGLWSKAQKQAVYDLLHYSISHSERDFEAYQKALLVPLGDRQARLELEKPVFDMSVVRRGLIHGRNSPEDVNGMATMFRHCRQLDQMSEAISIWSQGDALIEQLQQLGNDLHREISSERPNALGSQRWLGKWTPSEVNLPRLKTGFPMHWERERAAQSAYFWWSRPARLPFP